MMITKNQFGLLLYKIKKKHSNKKYEECSKLKYLKKKTFWRDFQLF